MKNVYLGAVDYDTALKLQLEERVLVKEGKSKGTIYYLEHKPAVITLGRHAIETNILLPEKLLESKGYQIRKVSRGGDVTVHEPGQLVVYFVVPLKAKVVRNFVDGIMNLVSTVLKSEYGLDSYFKPDVPGLWVEDRKICSLGFDLTQRVSMHGIALNISNSLEGFKMIVPCGLSGVKMTSLSNELGRVIEVSEILTKLDFALSLSTLSL